MPTAPAPSDVVTCPACGSDVERSEAREYDRYGDRWDRTGKTFEYFCKPCHRSVCHLPRTGLEALLIDVGTDHQTTGDFLAAYYGEIRSGSRASR